MGLFLGQDQKLQEVTDPGREKTAQHHNIPQQVIFNSYVSVQMKQMGCELWASDVLVGGFCKPWTEPGSLFPPVFGVNAKLR